MASPDFNLSGINFEVYNLSANDPECLPADETWQGVLDIRRQAFRGAYRQRSHAELDAFTGIDNPEAVIEGFKDPQTLVESGRLRSGQTFRNSQLAVAFDRDRSQPVVGYMNIADNTSGAHQALKRFMLTKDYVVVREAAVDPTYQHRGIALAMGYGLSRLVLPGRPSSAYTYPFEDSGRAAGVLSNIGYTLTDVSDETVFGEGEPTKMIRMQAKSARQVGRHILAMPGAAEALEPVKAQFSPKSIAQLFPPHFDLTDS